MSYFIKIISPKIHALSIHELLINWKKTTLAKTALLLLLNGLEKRAEEYSHDHCLFQSNFAAIMIVN